MKIKELLTEGPLDFAKGLFKTGSLAGAKAASQQAQATKEIKPFIDSIINSWNRYVGLTNKNTAADAVSWAAESFKSDISSVAKPANDTPEEINRFLTDVAKSYRAGALKSTAGTGTKYKQRQSAVTPMPQQQTPTASQPAGTIGATGKRGATAPQPQSYQSPLNITIRQSTDPVIVDYKGNPYMLNKQGEWAKDGGNNAAGEAVQVEIDKVLRANGLL
jgi:hypothetical protein